MPWGHKAFGGYLGADRAAWKQYDATELVRFQALNKLYTQWARSSHGIGMRSRVPARPNALSPVAYALGREIADMHPSSTWLLQS